MTDITKEAVIITNRTGAGRLLCSPRKCADIAFLVSIGGPTEREPAGFRRVARRIRLVFEDAEEQSEGGPSAEDIERLVQFARRVDFTKGKLLVHCQAGISRSSAAAIIVLATLLGAGRERDAISHVCQLNPHATPNRRMLALADAFLCAEGRLLEGCGGA